ncbi:MAG TPA: DUF1580 domain-containing protein [Pirellulaceae bacterium]|nr:DUF1580 domain-containing protein [Pirellulaceae bacterium]
MHVSTIDPYAIPYTPAGMKQLGLNPPPSPATLHRWRLRGLRGVRLETFLRGGRRFTTRDAVENFFERITAIADRAEPLGYTRRQEDEEIARAMKELEDEGA